jgi:hypothetical protein
VYLDVPITKILNRIEEQNKIDKSYDLSNDRLEKREIFVTSNENLITKGDTVPACQKEINLPTCSDTGTMTFGLPRSNISNLEYANIFLRTKKFFSSKRGFCTKKYDDR